MFAFCYEEKGIQLRMLDDSQRPSLAYVVLQVPLPGTNRMMEMDVWKTKGRDQDDTDLPASKDCIRRLQWHRSAHECYCTAAGIGNYSE